MSRPLFRRCVADGTPATRVHRKIGGLCERCWWMLDTIGQAQKAGKLEYPKQKEPRR